MKKRTIIALILFVLLTTITTQLNLSISKFNLNKIVIENNFIRKRRYQKITSINIWKKFNFFRCFSNKKCIDR